MRGCVASIHDTAEGRDVPLGILHMTIYTKTKPSFDVVQVGGRNDSGIRLVTVRYVPPGQDRTRPPTPGAFRV